MFEETGKGVVAVRPGLEQRIAVDLASGARVLVSRLQYLGDVVLTLPAVYAIKARYPNAEIDYLSRSVGAAVLEGEPAFGRVFRVPKKSEGNRATRRLVKHMRERRYAAAVDLYSNSRSALLTFLSGAKLRVGGARRVRKYLYTHPMIAPSGVRSAIDHHLYYVRPLGVTARATKPVLTIADGERDRALERLRDLGLDRISQTTVGIHPGGKWEVKRWPVEFFGDLAKRLIDRQGLRIVVLAGPGEESYQTVLRSQLGQRAVYVPPLSIRETAALIGALDGMVANDGGIMHVSVAVGTPTVGLFGSSEPDIWFPYESFGPFVPAYVPIDCRPCHRHTCDHLSCVRGLTPAEVEEKLVGVLGGASTKERRITRQAAGGLDAD